MGLAAALPCPKDTYKEITHRKTVVVVFLCACVFARVWLCACVCWRARLRASVSGRDWGLGREGGISTY